jgi:Sec-independent protein translocase protein TatA
VPDVARKLGKSVREVKDAVGEVDPRRMLESGDDSGGESKPKPESRKEPDP